jgi:uncharacterized membrane protein SpoIIM required for sporulation
MLIITRVENPKASKVMRQAEFEHQHNQEWQRIEDWLQQQERLSKKTKKNSNRSRASSHVEPVLDYGQWPSAFRALCSHLALARDRQYSSNLVDRINRLVLRGHHVLYAAQTKQAHGFVSFLLFGFPRMVRAEYKVVCIASILFFLPLFLIAASIQLYPELSSLWLSPEAMSQYEEMYRPDNHHLGMRESDTNFGMFGFYIWNNVRIGFQTFAGGLLFGLGSLFFLCYNGMSMGATIGHLIQIGFGHQIGSFVAGHSAMELVAIAISGAAGFKLGYALLAPGQYSRKAALVIAGNTAMRLMAGAAMMFCVAALIEAFWSPHQWGSVWVKYGVGLFMWVFTLSWLMLSGRGRAA